MKRLVPMLAVAVCACGLPQGAENAADEGPPDMTGAVRDAIVGGTTTRGDPEVFMLIIEANNGQGSLCTGTLIDRRTILTAAHCVDPRILGATSVNIYASNAPTEGEIVNGINLWRVVETRYHPTWNPSTLTGDIAVALLDRAPNVTPKPWNSATNINGFTNRPVRAVGYGTTGAAGNGSGVKRTVDLTFRRITGTLIYLGNQVNKGICHGDSGGPTFHTFSDGIERQVGVHSFTTTDACTDGADTRVDMYVPFVQQWLNEKEAPSCGQDGRCATSCSTPDIDCLCAQDGSCNAACPDLALDPDCPPDCGQNGVCSVDACPVADPDCVAVGNACSSPNSCVSRRCVNDPQHAQPYCSTPCQTASECPTNMQCSVDESCIFLQLPETPLGAGCVRGQSYCGLLAACTGPSDTNSVCGTTCVDNSNCQGEETCITGNDGVKICVAPAKPPIFLQRATLVGPASAGCATVPGGVLGLWALLGLARRRRVRA